MTERRVLLVPTDVSRDAIDDAFVELGLRMVNVVPRGAEAPEQVLASLAGGRTTAALVSDDRLGRVYVVVDGEEASRVGAALAGRLGVAAPDRSLRLALASLGGALVEP